MLNAVLIGLGNVAWRFGQDINSESSLNHKDALLKNNQVSLLAGYSPDYIQVNEFSKSTGIMGYTNLKKMLKEIKPDIVSICSPKEFHAEHIEICLDLNIPMIWLEKPATSSLEQLNSLQKRINLMPTPPTILVNFQRRYSECYQKMKYLIEQHQYGKPLLIEINYSLGLEVNGSHMIDILTYLFPNFNYELLWVEKDIKSENPDFIFRLSDRLLVHFSAIESNFHNLDIRIVFEKARLSIEHGGMSLRIEEVKENKLFAGFYCLYDEQTSELGKPGFNFSFDLALNDLISSNKKLSQPESNLSTAYFGQLLIEKVFKEINL